MPNPTIAKLFHYSAAVDNIDEYREIQGSLKGQDNHIQWDQKQLIQMICCITDRTPLLFPVISIMLLHRNNPKTKPFFLNLLTTVIRRNQQHKILKNTIFNYQRKKQNLQKQKKTYTHKKKNFSNMFQYKKT